MFDIIIVTYNAKEKLKKCIESIEKYTQKEKYHITIVDDNSNDGTRQHLKRCKKDITIIRNKKNRGFPYSANRGIKNTKGEFVFLLDDDIEVTEGWMQGLYGHAKKSPKVGIVGGKIVNPDNRIACADYSVKRLKRIGMGELDRGQRDYVKECDGMVGPCWLLRRKLFDDIGGFDERFFPTQAEDIDYCIRTRLANYKIIYDGRVKIIHHNLFREGKNALRNRKLFLKKWEGIYQRFPINSSCRKDKYLEKGIFCLKLGKYKHAINWFQKARLIDKRIPGPFYMGLAFYGEKRYKEAVKELKKVISLYPERDAFTIYARHYLAIIYKQIGYQTFATKEANLILKRLYEYPKRPFSGSFDFFETLPV